MSERQIPKTYLKFEGRKVVDGTKRQYWVQDATEDLFEEILDHFINNFIGDEPTTKYMKFNEDAVSLVEFRHLWRIFLEEKYTIVCLTKDDKNNTKLAGFNVLSLSKVEEKEDPKLEGHCINHLLNILKWVESQRNFHDEFKVPRVMKAMGLYVLQDYRGEGLGEKLLEAREFICRHVGVTATLTAFTSIISQKLAARVGFKDFYCIEYEELGKISEDMRIPDIHNHSKSLKYMYKLYN